jgi:predicted nucleic-acid-binding protein
MQKRIVKGSLFIIIAVIFVFARFYNLEENSIPTVINWLLSVLFFIIGIMEIEEGINNELK